MSVNVALCILKYVNAAILNTQQPRETSISGDSMGDRTSNACAYVQTRAVGTPAVEHVCGE
jgi:hypothetical protein